MAGLLRVERVDVHDDATLRAALTVLRAAWLAEQPDDPMPTEEEFVAMLRFPETSQRSEVWLGRDGARPVGAYRLDLPLLDNTDLVELELCVDPPARGRGHGRVLVAHATDRVAQLGRHQLVAGVSEPIDGSTNRAMRFAAAAGARRALGDMRRVLDLTALDHDRLAGLRESAEKAAAGYTVVGWTGPCPDDLVDGYAAVVARLLTDAPMGDLDVEAEHWDADRVREREGSWRAQARTTVTSAARVGVDGPLVAGTLVVVSSHDPVNVVQWETLVLAEHRGHRLGTLVKLANLERLLAAAPAARRLHTWNADQNSHMIAVNEAMGFVPVQRDSAWRLDLPVQA